jgi:PAS domain S-box-containing protein/putative nucleotidyltransferase with HDIG domain
MKPSDIDAPETISNIPAMMAKLLKDEHALWEGVHIRKDGRKIPVEIHNRLFEFEGKQLILSTVRDITERKQIKESLYKAEEQYRGIFENAQEGIFRTIPEGRFIMANQAMADMLGYESPEDLMTSISNTPRQLYVNPEDRLRFKQMIAEQGFVKHHEIQLYKKDGSIIWVSTNAHAKYDENGQLLYYEGMDVDITERKRAEEALCKSEEHYHVLANNITDVIWILNFDLQITFCSPSIQGLLGYDANEFLSKRIEEILAPSSYKMAMETLSEEMTMTISGPRTMELEMIHREGTTVWTELKARFLRDADGRPTSVLGVSRNISERKKAERSLQQSELRYRTLFNNANDALFVVKDFKFIDCNDSALKLYGCQREQLIGSNPYAFSPPTQPNGWDSKELALEKISLALAGEPQFFEWKHCKYDGTPFDAEVSLNRLQIGDETLIRAFVRDITERKKTEEALKQSEERFRALFERSLESVYIQDLRGRYINANQAALDMIGYTLEELRNIDPASLIIPEHAYIARKAFKNILQRGTQIGTTGFTLKRKDGGYVDVETAGALIYREGKPYAILGVSRDVTERNRSLNKLRRTLGATVQAVATVVETRDPYTAGHQRRVADLARSIATEMGLPSEQIDGIRMAALIHDIGKISVPAEILSKPTKLTQIEFELIKNHSKSGYDILKEVEFPWPIARMIREHHERIDGSGYPEHLTGDSLLIESRILSVADVVEAIASHRPYRPTLGISTAMAEITKNKGILYDADVVNACLRLFNQKGYRLID